MRRIGVVMLSAFALMSCGTNATPPPQHDAGQDLYVQRDMGPQDRPRERPDVAPVPGFSVSIDGVPWYVLNGSTNYSANEELVYLSAMVSCDDCTDVSQLVISLGSPATDNCGPSEDTLTFTRSSITSHPFRSAVGGNCGFQVSEAGGENSVRVAGSFHGEIVNIDTSITVTYQLDVSFDLAIGVTFP